MHAPEPVKVHGDVDLLFGAIENLLDNTLKFTPGGGAITLEAGIDAGQAVLHVADSGPGIEPGEREAVLRPFYRSPSQHAHETAGHGLGLSLVTTIARVHDADVDVDADVEIHDNQPGCKMVLRFRGCLLQ